MSENIDYIKDTVRRTWKYTKLASVAIVVIVIPQIINNPESASVSTLLWRTFVGVSIGFPSLFIFLLCAAFLGGLEDPECDEEHE